MSKVAKLVRRTLPRQTQTEVWRDYLRGKRAKKVSITIRVDADVVAWFKSEGGRGYQTRMNAVLRRFFMNVQGLDK